MVSAMDWPEAWWALVEASDPQVARRLHQGRQFHRAGRVTDLRIVAGEARARVQDSRATPVPVSVTVPVLDDAAWETVVATLAAQVRHTARLLAGHAPDGLDADLARAGVRVFPERGDLTVACDCEDPVWPCAHAAALWSVLAEALAGDPFVLLQLRGRGRERLLRELSEARRRRAHGDRVAGLDPAGLDLARWSAAQAPLEDIGVPAPEAPPTPAGALRLLGDPPGWAGGVGAWELLGPLIEGAAAWMAERDEATDADGAAPTS